MAHMKRWSNPKLDKELAFARAAKDKKHHENLAWLEILEREAFRRTMLSPKNDMN